MSLLVTAQAVSRKTIPSMDKFKYDLVKRRFVCSFLYGKYEMPLRKKQKRKLIYEIKQKKIVSEKYEVMEQDGKYILILKRDSPNKILEVLSLSEMFDVIAEVHLALHHKNIENAFYVLHSRYYVLLDWIKILYNCCNICIILKHTESPKNALRLNKHIVQVVTINDMVKNFNIGILYIDYSTNYILLRKMQKKTDIAYELFKIFMDFGVPDCIEVVNKAFFQGIIYDTLKGLLPNNNIHLVSRSLDYALTLQKEIASNLKIWRSYNKTDWTFKLIEIQWRINQRIGPVCKRSAICTDLQKENAYCALFNRDINVSISIPPYDETAQNKTPKISICGFCNKRVYKPYTCMHCLLKFHFYCCKRYIKVNKFDDREEKVLGVECFKCCINFMDD